MRFELGKLQEPAAFLPLVRRVLPSVWLLHMDPDIDCCSIRIGSRSISWSTNLLEYKIISYQLANRF